MGVDWCCLRRILGHFLVDLWVEENMGRRLSRTNPRVCRRKRYAGVFVGRRGVFLLSISSATRILYRSFKRNSKTLNCSLGEVDIATNFNIVVSNR